MYGGMQNGGMIPTSLGEVSRSGYGPYLGDSPVFNLAAAEYGADEYGPYLGNFFDDIAKIAGKVGTIAGTIGGVASGQQQVVTVPTSTINAAKTAASWLPYIIGGGVLLYFVTRKGGRK